MSANGAPRTTGKAELFIQTSLREWAYGRPYASPQDRAKAIKPSGSTATTSTARTRASKA